MGLLNWLFRESGDTDTDTEESEDDVLYDEPKERTSTKEVDRSKKFVEYEVVIDYTNGDTRTEYVTKYQKGDTTIELYDEDAILTTYHYFDYEDGRCDEPMIGSSGDEPTIISLPNVNSVEISVWQELVAVCEGIEVEVTEKQYKEGGEWQNPRPHFEMPDDPPEVEVWELTEWEAEH